MKRFRFRLERVLRVNRDRERISEVRFTDATCKAMTCKDRLAACEGEYRDETQAFREWGGVLDAQDLIALGTRLGIIRRSIREGLQELQEAEGERAERHGELLTDRRNRMVLEHLKEKRMLEHVREALKEEQRDLDEVALQHHE